MQPGPCFIIPDGVHPGLTMVGTSTSEHVITGLFQFSVGAGQIFSQSITPPHLCVVFSFGACLPSPLLGQGFYFRFLCNLIWYY